MPKICKFDKKLADYICDEIAAGSNLTKIAQRDDVPSVPTIYKWMRENDEFNVKYNVALQNRAQSRSDKLDYIIDRLSDGTIKADVANVMSNNLKWLATREDPSRFGDRVTNRLVGHDDGPVKLENALSKLGEFLDESS